MTEYVWESVSAISHIVGGSLFIGGSCFFLPQFEEYLFVGLWLYVAASILYLIVALHDFVKGIHHGWATTEWDKVDIIASGSYTMGAIWFIFGSIFFLPAVGMVKAGGWSYILGSILFVMGAFANAIQIFDDESSTTTTTINWMMGFYANLVFVQFVMGSALFLSASVPYTFDLDNDQDNTLIFKFSAILYICASVMFTFAGCFNYYRVILMINQAREEKSAKNCQMIETDA